MNREGILISERLDEVTRMCDRENPIYEQISNYSIALYLLGHFQCPDLLSSEDVDNVEAGCLLQQHFLQIEKEDVPLDYDIRQSSDRYLLVIGDPLFPFHFAVLVSQKSERPYFSKLELYGTGFDSLAELEKEFIGIDGIGRHDFYYYRMVRPASTHKEESKKIYTLRDNGDYAVFDYSYATMNKEGRTCR